MQRILPIAARLRARLLGNPRLFDRASEIIELAPAVDRMQPAAIALPGEFDRVVAVQEETTRAIELERLRESTRRHGATIGYRVDNTILGNGTLYFDGGYEVIRQRSSKRLLNGRQDHFSEAQLCSNYVIDRYFGHWLVDGLTLELLAAQRLLPAIGAANSLWPHEPGYRDLCDLTISRSDNARIDRLWVIDDRGLNDNWISRILELRLRVRSVAKQNGAKAKRVMLVRGTLGSRRNLVNSAEVVEELDRLGFQIINPESETPQSIVGKLSEVEMAIAVEGSGQNHCFLAMPRSSTLVTIQPPTRFNAHSKMRADAIGINWGFVVADLDPDGFFLPVDRLLRTIDEVVRRT